MEKKALQVPRSVKNDGDAPGVRAGIPLQPMEKTIGRQTVSLQPMEVHGGDTPADHGGSHAGGGQ